MTWPSTEAVHGAVDSRTGTLPVFSMMATAVCGAGDGAADRADADGGRGGGHEGSSVRVGLS
jgi:hypothetical protein